MIDFTLTKDKDVRYLMKIADEIELNLLNEDLDWYIPIQRTAIIITIVGMWVEMSRNDGFEVGK